DATGFHVLRTHRVNAEVSFDWLGDTLVVAQLDWTSRWQVHSDLYRWLPGGQWHRETRGARLVSPRAGGGRLSVIALLPAGNRPALPVPPGPAGGSATWGEVVPSPDGRHVAGTRSANGHCALLRWPADSPEAGTVLRESAGVITDPTWTPAGELLFVTDLTGCPQVYRWRDSTGAEPLTAEPLGARAPTALADGTLLYATLAADGWELRRARREEAGPPVAADRPVPFDSAPPVATRETGYAAWPSLRPHFWVPLFLDAGPSGRFWGGATAGTSLSDVCPGCAGHDLVGGSVTLALTHVVSAPVAVSRQDGFSWLALYRRRAEREGARWSSEARSRLGLYAHVPGVGGFAHHVLAVRLAAGASGGPLGERFKAGGVSSGARGPTFRQAPGAARRLQLYVAFASDF